MDWLLSRQVGVEKKLAKRHLAAGGPVLYDVSSRSYEGETCPLARRGYSRDGDGLPGIVYGPLTDGEGCPVAVAVYAGSTGDPSTVPDQVEKLRTRFELRRVVPVGDRGVLAQTQIDKLRAYPGTGWITAPRSEQIRELYEKGRVDRTLFDGVNPAEVEAAEEFPGERLMACFNPLLAEGRARKREELPAADAVRGYKRLSLVERAFRSVKGLSLLVRPVYHRLSDRVKAHVLLCLLAYHLVDCAEAYALEKGGRGVAVVPPCHGRKGALVRERWEELGIGRQPTGVRSCVEARSTSAPTAMPGPGSPGYGRVSRAANTRISTATCRLRLRGRPAASEGREVIARAGTWHEGVRTRRRVDENGVKMYDEHGVLRVEKTVNDPGMFRVYWHPGSGG